MTLHDDVLTLDGEYALTAAEIEHFREKGYVRLAGVLSAAEAAAYRQVIRDAALKHNRETRPLAERDTYGKAFLQVMNLWRVDEAVRQFVFSPRLAGIAARLMQVDAVRLYHDQALFKEPGGGHTPWHQDQYYWPLGDAATVTLWMPLIDISGEMGSMSFAEATHRHGFVSAGGQISDDSEAFFEEFVRSSRLPVSGGGAMAAGDATFHSGWTLHRAPGNVTDRTREVMTVIYYADGATVSPPANDNQEADRQTWLDGIAAGHPAAGPLNPVLFPVG